MEVCSCKAGRLACASTDVLVCKRLAERRVACATAAAAADAATAPGPSQRYYPPLPTPGSFPPSPSRQANQFVENARKSSHRPESPEQVCGCIWCACNRIVRSVAAFDAHDASPTLLLPSTLRLRSLK